MNEENLCICCINVDIIGIRYFLEKGANPNSAFLNACCRGNYEIVNLLLENGADPNLSCCDSYPLYEATRFNHPDIVGLLFYYEAKFNPELLTIAAKLDSMILVSMFLKKTTLVRYKNIALRNACKNGNIDMVRLLLVNGANPFFQESLCFRMALGRGYIDIAALLCYWEAQMSIQRFPFGK